jgi:glycosyltransferase involved in cell wall biosynthesis
VATNRSVLVLTRNRTSASFRQRIELYLDGLRGRGISSQVVELAKGPLGRRRDLAQAVPFGAVLLHRKTLTAWDAWCLGRQKPLIYDFDDAIMYQARAPDDPHGPRLRRFRRTVRRAALVIAGSPVLAEHAMQAGARLTRVLATGLDIRRYPRPQSYGGAGPVRLVWIGTRSTLKQLEEVRPVLEAIGRDSSGVVLRVICDAPLQVPGLAVENIRWSREMEARLLAESSIGIAPLPDTAYTRGKCGFKVIQYMAAGLPVIASPVGANAAYVQPEVNGLLARTAGEWVEAVRRLAGDEALRKRFGTAGLARAAAEFDVSVLGPTFYGLVEQALA